MRSGLHPIRLDVFNPSFCPSESELPSLNMGLLNHGPAPIPASLLSTVGPYFHSCQEGPVDTGSTASGKMTSQVKGRVGVYDDSDTGGGGVLGQVLTASYFLFKV